MPHRALAELTFDSPEATAGFAAAFADVLTQGDIILLTGPIGAGKTHFVRSAIQTLLRQQDRYEDVPSPSYTLVQTFALEGVEIWHADLYRLGDSSELDELGLFEAFGTHMCFVEWPNATEVAWPSSALEMDISLGSGDEVRKFVITGDPEVWDERLTSVLNQCGSP